MFGSAPAFWWGGPAWQCRLLAPAGAIHGALARRRMALPGVSVTVPVLCVGNVTAGGAGKTPMAIELGQRLLARGHRPAFLSRGHGRRSTGHDVITVDAARHAAGDVGDEPLLLARFAPTFVAADRRLSAAAAIAAGATVLVMDDGLQNPSLVKTASVVVVDGARGIGNGRCIPAGPLRAPLAAQWPAISLLCVIGRGAPGEAVAAGARARDIPVLRASLAPDPAALEALSGRRLFAFCGIGRPSKFFDTLLEAGLDVVGRRGFADHHAFRDGDRQALLAEAARHGAELVTTEKDRVRLPPDFGTHVLPVRVALHDGAGALDAVLDRLHGQRVSAAGRRGA